MTTKHEHAIPSTANRQIPAAEAAPAPDSRRAAHAIEGALRNCLGMVEDAIREDQIAGLNEFLVTRAALAYLTGDRGPWDAMRLYNEAVGLTFHERYREAEQCYLRAAQADPQLVWSINNLAWMLATCTDLTVRDGARAVRLATAACERSGWKCWAFLGTLAAAYAAAGDFANAVRWQEAALLLTPAEHQAQGRSELELYRAGIPLIGPTRRVAAGEDPEEAFGEPAESSSPRLH